MPRTRPVSSPALRGNGVEPALQPLQGVPQRPAGAAGPICRANPAGEGRAASAERGGHLDRSPEGDP
jgi:hypothetical protein